MTRASTMPLTIDRSNPLDLRPRMIETGWSPKLTVTMSSSPSLPMSAQAMALALTCAPVPVVERPR